MISELNLIWQLEDQINNLVENSSKHSESEKKFIAEKIEFLEEQIKMVKEQPRWDKWNFVKDNNLPLTDGRYQVWQIYLDDGYTEVSTAVYKNGRWKLETGEFNHKFGSYQLARKVIAWAPLQSPPSIEESEIKEYLEECLENYHEEKIIL